MNFTLTGWLKHQQSNEVKERQRDHRLIHFYSVHAMWNSNIHSSRTEKSFQTTENETTEWKLYHEGTQFFWSLPSPKRYSQGSGKCYHSPRNVSLFVWSSLISRPVRRNEKWKEQQKNGRRSRNANDDDLTTFSSAAWFMIIKESNRNSAFLHLLPPLDEVNAYDFRLLWRENLWFFVMEGCDRIYQTEKEKRWRKCRVFGISIIHD